MQRAFGERVAMNAPIQGTAADIMKMAMIGVNRALKEKQMKSKLVLQVHDELLIEAYKDEVDEVKSILKKKWNRRLLCVCHWILICIRETVGMRQNK